MFEDFDKKVNRVQNLAIGWFVFVALMALGSLAGVGYVIYRILLHFGIL